METKEDGRSGVGAALVEILINLADLKMSEVVTTRMAPVIYAIGIAGVAALNLYLLVQVFGHSTGFGVIWLLFIMPVLFVAGVAAIRVMLEVIVSLFRVTARTNHLFAEVTALRQQMEIVADDLSSIQFWRVGKRRSESKSQVTEDRENSPTNMEETDKKGKVEK